MIMTCIGLGRGRDDVWEFPYIMAIETEEKRRQGEVSVDGDHGRLCVRVVASARVMESSIGMDALRSRRYSGGLGPGLVLT